MGAQGRSNRPRDIDVRPAKTADPPAVVDQPPPVETVTIDPIKTVEPVLLTPVLDTTLPALGATPIATVTPLPTATAVPEAATLTPLQPVLQPTSPSMQVADLTLTFDNNPATGSVIGEGFVVTQSGSDVLAEAQAFGGTSATVATGGTYTGTVLGALPGMGLIAAEGDGKSVTTGPGGAVITTNIQTTENEKGVTKNTQVTTEQGGVVTSVVTTVETTEPDGDHVLITTTEQYGKDAWGNNVVQSSVTEAEGTKDGEEFEWFRNNKPEQTYDTGEGGVTDGTLSPVMAQMVATGMDPTLTDPSAPDVDDGGADTITAGAVAGATTVLGVTVKPGITDAGYEVDVVGAGDPTRALIVGGPDGVNPLDPDFAGGEPVSAADLNNPQPTNANPTSSGSALTADFSTATSGITLAGSGVIASTGGEDEDLEDLEPQRVTPRADTMSTTIANDPILGGAEPISAGALQPPLGGFDPVADSGGEDEDLEDLEIQRLTPRADTMSTTIANDPILGGAEPISAGALQPPLGGFDPVADSGGEDEDLEDLEPQRLSPRAFAVATTVDSDPILGGAEPITFDPVVLPDGPLQALVVDDGLPDDDLDLP